MLFTIGQVTKMYNISHDTLRYYDKINLLKPSVKKENGYRYYTIREIELLEIILVAKQLEIPIKDIKSIIEKEDENSYIELFKNHKKILEEKIEYLSKLKTQVQHSIEITTEMKEFDNCKGKELKEEYINKTILYFHQNDYGYFNDLINQKNLVFKSGYTNDGIVIQETIVGFELDKEIIDEKVSYEIKKYEGRYITLTVKDTSSNIEKFIYDSVNEIYKNKDIINDINIFMESIFTLFKVNKGSIYFAKIYIEYIE